MKFKFHRKIIFGAKLKLMVNSSFKFIDIDPGSLSDAEILYERLASRKYSISHKTLPTFERHQEFVSSHPYLHWCFIVKEHTIGTYYVTDLNSVGIEIDEEFYESIPVIALEISRRHTPLPPVRSVRPASFCINVSSQNAQLCNVLEKNGFVEIQRTFSLLSNLSSQELLTKRA